MVAEPASSGPEGSINALTALLRTVDLPAAAEGRSCVKHSLRSQSKVIAGWRERQEDSVVGSPAERRPSGWPSASYSPLAPMASWSSAKPQGWCSRCRRCRGTPPGRAAAVRAARGRFGGRIASVGRDGLVAPAWLGYAVLEGGVRRAGGHLPDTRVVGETRCGTGSIGGDRRLNRALTTVVIVRMRTFPRLDSRPWTKVRVRTMTPPIPPRKAMRTRPTLKQRQPRARHQRRPVPVLPATSVFRAKGQALPGEPGGGIPIRCP